MTWTANPLFFTRKKPAADAEAAAANVEAAAADVEAAAATHPPQEDVQGGFLKPSNRFTGHQIFYLVIPHGIIAAIISGVINLAIAVAMYGTTKQKINLFQFPNTLVGDATVTCILQCIITWMAELILVNHDLKHGRMQPLGRFGEPKNAVLRWLLFLDRGEATCDGGGFMHWLRFLYSQVLRAVMVGIISFGILIGPVIGFLTLVGTREGGDWTFTGSIHPSLHDWKPMIFKATLGATLGIFTTPFFALFWMVRCGWALINNERHYGER